jgi:hypothetical protein
MPSSTRPRGGPGTRGPTDEIDVGRHQVSPFHATAAGLVEPGIRPRPDDSGRHSKNSRPARTPDGVAAGTPRSRSSPGRSTWYGERVLHPRASVAPASGTGAARLDRRRQRRSRRRRPSRLARPPFRRAPHGSPPALASRESAPIRWPSPDEQGCPLRPTGSRGDGVSFQVEACAARSTSPSRTIP